MKRLSFLVFIYLLPLLFSIATPTEPAPTIDTIPTDLFDLTSLPQLIARGEYSPVCSMCEDLSSYSNSFMNIINDESTFSFQVALTNSSRAPVQRAPIIIRINGSSGDTYQVVYTDSRGIATFDYSSYNSSCQKFTAFYCYGYNSCSFLKCLHALGFQEGSEPYTDFNSIPLAPRQTRPSARQIPPLIKSSSASFNYCPRPRLAVSTTPAFCLPLILISALLLGALYLSGRNPFLAFDLSNPHVGKHIRYTARQRTIYHADTMGAAIAATKAVGGIANPKQARAQERQQLRQGSGFIGLAGTFINGVRQVVGGRRNIGSTLRDLSASGERGRTLRRRAREEGMFGVAWKAARDSTVESLGQSNLGRMIQAIRVAARTSDPSTTLLNRVGNVTVAILSASVFGYFVYEFQSTVSSIQLARDMQTALNNFTNYREVRRNEEQTTIDGRRVTVTRQYTITVRNGQASISACELDRHGNVVQGSTQNVDAVSVPAEVSRSFNSAIHSRALTFYRTAAVENSNRTNDEAIRLGDLAANAFRGRNLDALPVDHPLRQALGGMVFGTSDERMHLGRAVAAALTDSSRVNNPVFWERFSSVVGEDNARRLFVSAHQIIAYDSQNAYAQRYVSLLESMPTDRAMSNQMFFAYSQLMAHATNSTAAQTLAAAALARVASSSSETFSVIPSVNNDPSLIGRFQLASDISTTSSECDLATLGMARAAALNPGLSIPNVSAMYTRFDLDALARDASQFLLHDPTGVRTEILSDYQRVFGEQVAEIRDFWRGVSYLSGAYADPNSSIDRASSVDRARLNISALSNISTSLASEDAREDALRYIRTFVHVELSGDQAHMDRIVASLERFVHASGDTERRNESLRLSGIESLIDTETNLRAQALVGIDRQRAYEFTRSDLQRQLESLPADDPRRTILEQRMESLSSAYETFNEANSALASAHSSNDATVRQSAESDFTRAESSFRTLIASSLGARADSFIESNLPNAARERFVENRIALSNTEAALHSGITEAVGRITDPSQLEGPRSQVAERVFNSSLSSYQSAMAAVASSASVEDLRQLASDLRQRELDSLNAQRNSDPSADLNHRRYQEQEDEINRRYSQADNAYQRLIETPRITREESRRIDREDESTPAEEPGSHRTTSYHSTDSYAARNAANQQASDRANNEFREAVLTNCFLAGRADQNYAHNFLADHSSSRVAADLNRARAGVLTQSGQSFTDSPTLTGHLPSFSLSTGSQPTQTDFNRSEFVWDPVTRTMVRR